jgi:5-oxoprolinase (ATP-hydrolysing) subunit A
VRIDLNADLGESFGRWRLGDDEAMLDIVTSANVACGFHAGDPTTLKRTCAEATARGVIIGAQVGYRDLAGFGRRYIDVAPEDLEADVLYQLGALDAMARAGGGRVRYVKPHGALYNQACREDAYARPVVAAVEAFGLAVLGLPGSRLEAVSRGRCPFVAEGFADRRYLPDGSLVPRSRPDAFVTDPDEAVRQAERLTRERGIRSLCVHGDNPAALAFVRALREALTKNGIAIRAFA